eukprot:superscaffoldBa00002747_g15175
MGSRVFMLLIGAVYIYYQVHAAEIVYIGELMVESNVTLEMETILSALDSTVIQVKDTNSVTLSDSELVAGMVTIEAPDTKVCDMSSPILKCTLEEETDSAGWNMSKKHERFELNKGSIYECGFTRGSVRHTAKTQLRVALLPDEITLKINPLTVDCSDKKDSDSVNVNVIATILNSTESYVVWWSYRGFTCNVHKKTNQVLPPYHVTSLLCD